MELDAGVKTRIPSVGEASSFARGEGEARSFAYGMGFRFLLRFRLK
jgi:hypothetical protein